MRKKLRKEKSRGNWVRGNNDNVKKGDGDKSVRRDTGENKDSVILDVVTRNCSDFQLIIQRGKPQNLENCRCPCRL